jgi:hypothetical protein
VDEACPFGPHARLAAKFEEKRGCELKMKRTHKKKKNSFEISLKC